MSKLRSKEELMKVIKWILISVVVLTALVVGSVTFLLNPAVKKLKPSLVAKISAAIGTEVELNDISAQLFPSPKIELSGLRVAGENGLSLNSLLIDSTLSELVSGKIIIRNIAIDHGSNDLSTERSHQVIEV